MLTISIGRGDGYTDNISKVHCQEKTLMTPFWIEKKKNSDPRIEIQYQNIHQFYKYSKRLGILKNSIIRSVRHSRSVLIQQGYFHSLSQMLPIVFMLAILLVVANIKKKYK
jgi:hypothetical protein